MPLSILKRKSIIPGFGLSLAVTGSALSLVVLLPLAALALKSTQLGWSGFWQAVTSPRVLATYRISFGCALVAAALNLILGLPIAWVLARYHFPGRRLLDAAIDLPIALPTAVAGITLTALFAPNGWLGQFLEPLGIHVVYTPLGITLALVFIGMPFIVRTVQPVLEDLDPEIEEASACLGASFGQTLRRVIWPELRGAAITGFTLAFARSVGEYGSVVFIAGNMPMKTEITPLLIISKLEEYDYAGATALGVASLIISFSFLLAINYLQNRYELQRSGH
jgi:sulfate transport system permease protein